MGGLSAAAILAKAGKKTLVIERHDRPGGYAHAFKRRQYLFDAAVHQIGGCEPTVQPRAGLIDRLLRVLGVRDHCSFLKLNPFYTAVFPGFRLAAPIGVEDFFAAHVDHFPGEAQGLCTILELCAALNREVREFPIEQSLWNVVRMPKRFPRLFRYHTATLGRVMDAYLSDPRLKALFAALWPYLGLPHTTPIRGLYLSGHWTQPGGGVYGVVASGLETARAVAGDEVLADFIGTPPSA